VCSKVYNVQIVVCLISTCMVLGFALALLGAVYYACLVQDGLSGQGCLALLFVRCAWLFVVGLCVGMCLGVGSRHKVQDDYTSHLRPPGNPHSWPDMMIGLQQQGGLLWCPRQANDGSKSSKGPLACVAAVTAAGRNCWVRIILQGHVWFSRIAAVEMCVCVAADWHASSSSAAGGLMVSVVCCCL
jgi:hypothetical protein